MFSRRHVLRAACGVFGMAALGLTGCGGDSNGVNPVAGTPARTTSRVRAFNGLIGTADNTVDIAASGYTQQALALGASTPYTTTTSAQVTSTSVSSGGQSVVQTALKLTPGTNYTLAVMGALGQSGAYTPRIIAIGDRIPTGLPPDKVALRTLNLSPSPTIPTIFVTGTSPDVQNGAEVVFNADNPFGYNGTDTEPNISTNIYVVQTAGKYTLLIRDNNRNLLLQMDNVNLVGNRVYTLYFYGVNTPGASQPLAAKIVADAP